MAGSRSVKKKNPASEEISGTSLYLTILLLMTLFAQTFLAFMCCHLVAFALLAARHVPSFRLAYT